MCSLVALQRAAQRVPRCAACCVPPFPTSSVQGCTPVDFTSTPRRTAQMALPGVVRLFLLPSRGPVGFRRSFQVTTGLLTLSAPLPRFPGFRVVGSASCFFSLVTLSANPGPFHDGAPRGALDLQGGFASSTQHKMDKALSAFAVWLQGSFGLELEAVLSSASSAALALRAFGLYLYSSGQPRYLLVYAITSVQDSHPQFRSQLAPAWQVDRKWQQAEPGECRPVISQPIIQASVALALCWGWHDWACLALIGFLCMLHPAEMLSLTRQDSLKTLCLRTRLRMFIFAALTLIGLLGGSIPRLEDPLVLQMLQALYSDLPLASRLFRGSMLTYRRQWNAVMARLGVPHRLSERGATPGVLRAPARRFCIWRRRICHWWHGTGDGARPRQLSFTFRRSRPSFYYNAYRAGLASASSC